MGCHIDHHFTQLSVLDFALPQSFDFFFALVKLLFALLQSFSGSFQLLSQVAIGFDIGFCFGVDDFRELKIESVVRFSFLRGRSFLHMFYLGSKFIYSFVLSFHLKLELTLIFLECFYDRLCLCMFLGVMLNLIVFVHHSGSHLAELFFHLFGVFNEFLVAVDNGSIQLKLVFQIIVFLSLLKKFLSICVVLLKLFFMGYGHIGYLLPQNFNLAVFAITHISQYSRRKSLLFRGVGILVDHILQFFYFFAAFLQLLRESPNLAFQLQFFVANDFHDLMQSIVFVIQLQNLVIHAFFLLFPWGLLAFTADHLFNNSLQILLSGLRGFQYFFDKNPLVFGLCRRFDEQFQQFVKLFLVTGVCNLYKVNFFALHFTRKNVLPKVLNRFEEHFQIRKAMGKGARIVLITANYREILYEAHQVQQHKSVPKLLQSGWWRVDFFEFTDILDVGVGFGGLCLRVFIDFLHFEFKLSEQMRPLMQQKREELQNGGVYCK